jgi:GNAT superfamily N-acetyltransferase
MGAFTLGASTFLVEGAGAMAAASLLGSERAQRLNAALEKRINREDGTKTSKLTKAVAALAIGATASMAIEHIEDPHRTVAQNRKYGLLTSAGLGGVLAIGGAAGTEAVTATIENPVVVAPIAGSVALLEVARRKWRSIMRHPHEVEDPLTEEWKDSDKRHKYHLLSDPTETVKAAITEQNVWDEKGFGKLDEAGYTGHIEHSRTFVAFDKDGECKGVNRMFGAYEDVLPPFLELPFDSEEEREMLSQRARDGKLEELGTVAVVEDARGQGVNGRLWRLAYRDAVARGVEEWGIIMEPERVAKLNKYHGFTFRQLGSAVDYQGGDCAAFVMNLEESVANMQKKHPLQQFALVRLRLKP